MGLAPRKLVALQDGSLIAWGVDEIREANTPADPYYASAVKFAPNGALDRSFGDGGEAYLDALNPAPDSDTAAPDTAITGQPDSPVQASNAAFTFTSTEAGSTFECRLDSAAWAACASPHQLTGLADGGHIFAVRATDEAGSTDETPATYDFSVQTRPSAQQVAERFRPNLYFDSSEAYRPLDIPAFLAEGHTEACQAATHTDCQAVTGLSALQPLTPQMPATRAASQAGSNGRVLEVDPAHAKDHDCDRASGPGCPAPALYYSVQDGSSAYQYINYWSFYRYNDYPGTAADPTFGLDHQADLEGVTVVAPKDNELTSPLAYAILFAHGHGHGYLDGVLRCTPGHTGSCDGQTRLNVYPAHGSHASYPRRCSSTSVLGADIGCSQVSDVPFEGNFDGQSPWQHNDDASALKPLPSEVTHWGGKWGHEQKVDSPGWDANWEQYNAPWEAECTSAWAGENPTADGCNAFTRSAKRPAHVRPDRVRQPSAVKRPAASRRPGSHAKTVRAGTPGASADDCGFWFGPLVAAAACSPDRVNQALQDGTLNANPAHLRVPRRYLPARTPATASPRASASR